jgi:hypothetical protein
VTDMDIKNALTFGVHFAVWAAVLIGGYMSLDTIAAVSQRLETFTIAALAIYGMATPLIMAVGLVFWHRARRDAAANQVRW